MLVYGEVGKLVGARSAATNFMLPLDTLWPLESCAARLGEAHFS